jgi:hypothetical protein
MMPNYRVYGYRKVCLSRMGAVKTLQGAELWNSLTTDPGRIPGPPPLRARVINKSSSNCGVEVYDTRPLSSNGSQNNDKKMKWLVEAIGVLVHHDALHREEGKRLRCA